MMTKDKFSLPTLEALLEAEVLDEHAHGEDEVDAELEALGFSSAAMEEEALQLIAQLEGGELDWQHQARKKLNQHHHVLRRQPQGAPSSLRHELLERIEAARRHPIFGQELATYFRHRSPEQVTEEELRGLLEDVERLRQLIESED